MALIARFDRVNGRRIPYVSAATMLGADPRDPAAHACTELVEALRRDGASVKSDLEELWRRIAFSILITNVDDHLTMASCTSSGAAGDSLPPSTSTPSPSASES